MSKTDDELIKYNEWYELQLEKVENNEYTTKRKNILTFNKREKLHRLNEPNNEMINSLRENVIRIYDEHYMNCYVNNFMNERLKLKDYIDATVENVSSCEIWNGLMQSIREHTIWLTRFAKDMPGFEKLPIEDLSAMIHSAVGLTFALETNQFFQNNKNETVLHNKIQFSRNRMNICGKFETDLTFFLHDAIRALDLKQTEKKLFYPLVLCTTNLNLIKEKEYLLKLQCYFEDIFLREIEANQRDSQFNDLLIKFFEQISVCEILKESYHP